VNRLPAIPEGLALAGFLAAGPEGRDFAAGAVVLTVVALSGWSSVVVFGVAAAAVVAAAHNPDDAPDDRQSETEADLSPDLDIAIEEHTTGTADYTDLVFGLFDLCGLKFSPRIRDIADQRLWRLPTKPSPSSCGASPWTMTGQHAKMSRGQLEGRMPISKSEFSSFDGFESLSKTHGRRRYPTAIRSWRPVKSD